MSNLQELRARIEASLGTRVKALEQGYGELTLVVGADAYAESMRILRDEPLLGFDMLVDLCGVDYYSYRDVEWDGPRFAAVSHLLSVDNNWRLRVRVFCPDDDLPVIASVTGIWPAANWYEREAFDLYGIVFEGHTDLRRILTDYGFVGHPFRKDFPVSGYVEMRYDPAQGRVIYQPVTIEPREIVPRVIREEGYGAGR